MNEMTLTIPAQKEWALVMRMTASGIGAMYDLPLDIIEDLKTALDESFDLLMHQPFCIKNITLQSKLLSNGLSIHLSATKCDQMQTEEAPVDPEIAGLIIGTLCKQVDFCRDSEGVCGVTMLLPAKDHGC